jgi:hypothetical protein
MGGGCSGYSDLLFKYNLWREEDVAKLPHMSDKQTV